MDTSTSRRNILITGCGRGLGHALVREFVEAGHLVCGGTRNPQVVEALRAEFPAPHRFDTVDVTSEEEITTWAQDLEVADRIPDLLINNAGIIHTPAPLWEIEEAVFRELLDVNVLGVHRMIRAFLPLMATRNGGVIANLSSGAGRHGYPEIAAYCASKWAIEGLSQALAAESPAKITVVAVSPGAVDTDMLRRIWGDDAGNAPNVNAWAKVAAPFFLGLDASHHGQAVTTPSVS